MIKKGSFVKQIIAAPIQGEVIGFQTCQETGESLVQVAWTEKGAYQQRYFKKDEIEELEFLE